MIKKRIALVLSCIFVFNIYGTVFAEEGDVSSEEEVCSTGALEMSSQQLSEFLDTLPQIVDVKPNQLYNERLMEEYTGSDATLAGALNIVDDGDEIITDRDNVPSTFSGNEIIYPTKVDNSKRETFPFIGNQGLFNSCEGWSFAYYQLTNNANKVRGKTARNDLRNINSRVYSPNWVYNLGNNGSDDGMYSSHALNVLYTYGCPSLSEVDIETDNSVAKNYLNWYPKVTTWENALYNKCDVYYGTVNPDNLDTPITSYDSSYLNNLKRLLADGYVVTVETFATYDKNDDFPVVKKGKTSKNLSEYAWTEVRYTENIGHAVTIVGYDDGFRVDINGNGSYQSGEYGAFKIANSWGSNAPEHNGGYVWLSYDALNAASSVKSSVHSGRRAAFGYGDVYYFVKPQIDYKPLLTAEVKMNLRYRNDITAYIGIEDIENPHYCCEKKITENESIDDTDFASHIAFGACDGKYNLRGERQMDSGSVVFDFGTLFQEFEIKDNRSYNVYIKFLNRSERTMTINSFKLKDHNTGNEYVCSQVPASNDDNGIVRLNIAYQSSVATAKPDKQFSLKFNSRINGNLLSDTVVTLINDEGDYVDIDLSISDDDEKIMLNKQNGNFENGFYTINISPELRSKGGNYLTNGATCSFYVPFH